MRTHINLVKIEDVLIIPNLSEKYKVSAQRLSDKINFFETRGLYDHDKYFAYLKEAQTLMIELQSKSDYIHYNDF